MCCWPTCAGERRCGGRGSWERRIRGERRDGRCVLARGGPCARRNGDGSGDVTGLIHAAGVSPTQASPATILKVDLYGTALVLEEFGNVIARGGSGVVIASQSGHRLPPLTVEQNKALATTPVEELLSLPFLQPDQVDGFPARLPALQARELAARDGRGGALGQARRAGQHDQPRHHHDPAREGRTHRPAWRRLPAHDRGIGGRARRHAGRGGRMSARCSWARTAGSSPAATS